ncbi:alpha/beta fold hydrolase [Umezawaea endophytica]|uniref:Alpha/beta hydrolase n=1 Tax=Umezawaea endophytica TaxID=1654476 RepID=A0A9X2VKQ6_9PSEU|nr:alpha/beta hydrolase [Umezawaea endophytica]MCS7478415.1 alpha/beta hydrolase [Umezawaea endophytica]
MSNPAVVVDTLRVPDASLHYEVRGRGPLVVLVGAPMDAGAFEGLAELLAVDHTVLTTDPRGINRSSVDFPDRDSTPEMRADDLARLIREVDAGAAVVFGSSGGAVSALALAQGYPELVRVVIAHEPPLVELLPDREELRAGTDEIIALHAAGDVVGAWRKFLAQANISMPEEVFQMMFAGERSEQQVADDRFQHEHMMVPTVAFEPDVEGLRAGAVRVVVGIGEESGGQICDRTSRALAGVLGVEPTFFPGDHIGFVGDAGAFEVRLREVLAAVVVG